MLKDEIDFIKIIRYFLRAWPYFLISFILFGGLAVLINNDFPHLFEAKTSMLIAKPQRLDDPNRIILGMQMYEKDGDYFFVNQRINLKTQPLVLSGLQKTHQEITYLKKGVIMDKDIYKHSPFEVALDRKKMSLRREETPFNVPFEVQFIDQQKYQLTAEGKFPYPMDDKDFLLEGTYSFGQWIDTLGLRFRLVATDSAAYQKNTLGLENILDNKYAFVINDLNELALSYSENIEVIPEELDASIMKVSLSGANQAKLIDFLNALNQSFIENHLEGKTRILKNALQSVDQELKVLGDKLTLNEENIKDFKTYYGVTELTHKSELLLGRIMELENDKIDLDAKEEYFAYLKALLQSNKSLDQLISPEAYGIEDQVLIKLTQDLIAQTIERIAFEKEGTKENPIYKQLVSQTEQTKSAILQTVTGFEKTNQVTLSALNKRVNELEIMLQQLPEAEKQLVRLEREFMTNTELYNNFKTKRSELEVSIASVTPDFMVNEAPYITSSEPYFPNPVLVFPVAILLALMIPLGLLTFKRLLNPHILEPNDVIGLVGESAYVGTLDKSTVQTLDQQVKYPQALVNLELDAVYNIIQNRISQPLKKLAITSGKTKEGKHLVSELLCGSLQLKGRSVLWINLNTWDKKYGQSFKEKSVIFEQDLFHVRQLDNKFFYAELKNPKSLPTEMAVDQMMHVLKAEKYDHVVYQFPAYNHFPAILKYLPTMDAVLWVFKRDASLIDEARNHHQAIETVRVSKIFYLLTNTYEKLGFFGFFDGQYKNKPRNVLTWFLDLFRRL